jgi:uncharacterized protein YjlB
MDIEQVHAEVFYFEDDGYFPNSRLPVILYRSAIVSWELKEAENDVRQLVMSKQWRLDWTGKVYKKPHYHSNTHETLVCCSGRAKLFLGNWRIGQDADMDAGDVLIIPAGVAHECRWSSFDFRVFGVYPHGERYDMCHGRKRERKQSIQNLCRVPIPAFDPFFGSMGLLTKLWKK